MFEDLDGSTTGQSNSVVVYRNNLTYDNPNCALDASFYNGIMCKKINRWIRFSWNSLKPTFVNWVNVTNIRNKKTSILKQAKRLTHKLGFMAALEANQEYLLELDGEPSPVNLSYSGTFFDVYPNDYMIIKHKLRVKPDGVWFNFFPANESSSPLNSTNVNGNWYWDEKTSIISYIIQNTNIKPFVDIKVDFNVFKCRYSGCKPIQPSMLKPPVKSRPLDALFWSNISTWNFSEPGWGGYVSNGVYQLPIVNDRVKIPENKYVVVDCSLPALKYLQIEGVLEFDNKIDHKLQVEVIFINGGQLIIGWENDPILKNVEIILKGTRNSFEFRLPNGYDSIGGKSIGVFGGLDLHGRPRVPSWTRLQTSSYSNSSEIVLIEPVDWEIGKLNLTNKDFFLSI